MLTKIEIENFKSFKERTVIDFRSTNYKILKDTNVADNGILKGGIFVGANASGKTNIILAMRALFDLLFTEKFVDLFIYKCLFSRESNVVLNYEFEIDKNIINYNIEYNVIKNVMVERLYINGEIKLDRIGKSAKSYITDNTEFTDIDDNTLLLRSIYFNTKFSNFPILKKWFNFLINSVYIDASMRKQIAPKISDLRLSQYLKGNGVDIINNFLKEYNFKQQIEYSEKSEGNIININDNEGKKHIFFKRDEIGEPIPYEIESLGNKNLLYMLPAFFQVVNNDGMLIIDEFSSAFHNDLEELLVKYFMKNSKNSQIFLVSHSTNLLSNNIFRPDQEFAVEFHGSDGSRINRFSNDKPREAQNIEKMYSSGVFGGLPGYENGKH